MLSISELLNKEHLSDSNSKSTIDSVKEVFEPESLNASVNVSVNTSIEPLTPQNNTPETIPPSNTNTQNYCQKCNKYFYSELELVSHSHSRPFNCHNCSLSFIRKHDLLRHERIHSNLKPYHCIRCGKGFVRKDALKRHESMDIGVRRFRCAIS